MAGQVSPCPRFRRNTESAQDGLGKLVLLLELRWWGAEGVDLGLLSVEDFAAEVGA